MPDCFTKLPSSDMVAGVFWVDTLVADEELPSSDMVTGFLSISCPDLDKKLATDVPSSSKYKEKRIAPMRREKRTTVKNLFTLKNKSLKTTLCTPKSDGSSSSRSDGLQMIKTVTDNMLMTKSMAPAASLASMTLCFLTELRKETCSFSRLVLVQMS
ncbi:hypothetical protein JCGZ_13498 [Jatropha curcas]|uniref:Uncharacterized protein n=1 Tax=Jatropha curcas TaxID=180498 RepID=A0A067LCB6_JATCU|nr:hypothetical protein JCGZ_13498 [Jatropha curcas]